LQLARQRGYRTVNVVRREDAAEVVRETGGDVVLLDGEDLAQRVSAATDGARRSGSVSMRWAGARPGVSRIACARAQRWSTTAA